MSRIGKQSILLPVGVSATVAKDQVTLKGPKGQLQWALAPALRVEIKDQHLWVQRANELTKTRALHGLTRAVLANLVKGVTEGFRKELDLEGVGYRVAQLGTGLKFQLGFSHEIEFKPLPGITLKAEGQNKVIVEGIDKQKVGQVAANIRALRQVEPYKGKGIRYMGERVRRKEGKSGKKA